MRRLLIALPLVLATASCGGSDDANTQSVDVNAAAERAQGDIDTYAANTAPNKATPDRVAAEPAPAPVATRSPSKVPAPVEPAAPGTADGLPDDRTPVSEAPFTADSAQGAANVVQIYFALVEAGKYGRAWRLWDNGGSASGQSRAGFASGFAAFSEYHAQVGAPGPIDAGAGQRYVEVPIQVYGRLKAGAQPFRTAGKVVLHRTGDIDGATAEQRSWHIREIDLKHPPGGGDNAVSSTPAH